MMSNHKHSGDSPIDGIVSRLPHTKDGAPILIGDQIWFENQDTSYWGDNEYIQQVVSSITNNDATFNYEGDFIICCEDWEGGNMNCYAEKPNRG